MLANVCLTPFTGVHSPNKKAGSRFLNTQPHILMTGAGAPGAAGIIKCLLQDRSVKLTVADADEKAVGRFLHPAFFTIPKATDKQFIESLLGIARQQGVSHILPLVTKELFPLAQQKWQFEKAGIKVLVSPYEAIRIANDKAACYRFLKEKGIPVPNHFVAGTIDEFVHAAFTLGHSKEPFCFKPAQANGSRGFRVVWDSINEAEQLFLEKPYNTFITYTHALKVLSMQPFPPLVISEYLPGDEFSVDCLANHGKAVVVVPRLRQKMVNGISVQGRFVNDTEIIAYCTAIIEAIGLHGNIGIQVKRSAQGQALLLEINPRVQGTIVAGLGAGINLPLLAVKQEAGQALRASELQVNWGTSFSRHWTEVFY